MDELLRSAIVQGDTESFDARLSKVDPTEPTETGRTLLHVTASSGRPAMAKKLIERGVDLDAQNANGKTALHVALERDHNGPAHDAVARLLIEAGAAIDIEDRHGNQPLSRAVTFQKLKLTKLLVQRGANPNYENKYGNSPISTARKTGAKDYLDVMADASARLPKAGSDVPATGLQAGLTRVDAESNITEWIWDHLVPLQGPADTVQGELLRSVRNLRSEAQRNGNANWGRRFERFVGTLEDWLVDDELFSQQELEAMIDDIDRLRNSEYTPYVNDDLYDRLEKRIAAFCEHYPALIEYPGQPNYTSADLLTRYRLHQNRFTPAGRTREADGNWFVEICLEYNDGIEPVVQYRKGVLNCACLDDEQLRRADDVIAHAGLPVATQGDNFITVIGLDSDLHTAADVSDRLLREVYDCALSDVAQLRERQL